MKNIGFLLVYSLLVLISSCKTTEELKAPEISEPVVSVEDAVTESTHIAGTIRDGSGEALIGANILIKGTSEYALTDIDGSYDLIVSKPVPITVVFSFTGYDSQEIVINSSNTEMNVVLENYSSLDEVVVTGLEGETRGAVTKSKEILVVADGMERSSAPAEMRSKRGPEADLSTTGTVRIPGEEEVNPKAGQITAAEWNDLYNWEKWNELLNNQDYNEMQSHWQIYPRSRYSVFVRNEYELPLQDIPVELLDKSGKLLWSARTDNAGRAELWADINTRDKSFEQVNARVVVNNVSKMINDLKSIEEGVNHIDVKTECITSPNVDILFTVDATGSMGDEIRFLQSELQDVISRSLASNTKLKVRMGSVFYRDSTDSYVTQVQPLSDEPLKTLDFISEQSANGGGDYPEAVDAALEESLAQDWSENAVARIIFLLLDAPPHHNPTVIKRLQQQVADAAKEGIKIIPITASGINRQTEFLMKFMAIATNGTYVFITDHSGIGNPHLDPVVQDFEVEKLNDLLVRLLYNYTKSNGCNANEPINEGIAFFPNPAKDFVNITTDKPIPMIKILSNTGMVVHTRSNIEKGETRLDLAGLVDGVYTVHCSGDELDFAQSVVVINR